MPKGRAAQSRPAGKTDEAKAVEDAIFEAAEGWEPTETAEDIARRAHEAHPELPYESLLAEAKAAEADWEEYLRDREELTR